MSVSVCYINLGALTLGVYMLMSAMSSSCIDPFTIWCPSLSFFFFFLIHATFYFIFLIFLKFYFIFKLYNIVLVLPFFMDIV